MGSFAMLLAFPWVFFPMAESAHMNYGIGYSDSIEAGNPVFQGEIVAKYKNNWNVKFKHESSLFGHDEGFGENSLVVYKTIKLKYR